MFTDEEKNEAEALLAEAFDTYREQIVIYRKPSTAFFSESDPSFVFGFGNSQPAVDAQYVSQSGVFWATVEYVDQEDDQKLFHPSNQTPVQLRYGDVRISTTGETALAFLEDCEKVVIDGKDFRRVSDILPRGLFSRGGYDCWLKKIDNG